NPCLPGFTFPDGQRLGHRALGIPRQLLPPRTLRVAHRLAQPLVADLEPFAVLPVQAGRNRVVRAKRLTAAAAPLPGSLERSDPFLPERRPAWLEKVLKFPVGR